MRVLIVEDEALFSGYLEVIIDGLGYERSATVTNAEDALASVRDDPPELVLMDINIAGAYDGVETAEMIYNDHNCAIIFITAYRDERTFLRANRIGPANFLLKPFDELQVKRAIQVAVAGLTDDQSGLPESRADTLEEDNLYVKTGYKLRKIPVAEITSINADGRYCEIHTLKQRYLVRLPLAELQGRLPPNFLKTHRSHLINEEYVDSIDLRDNEVVLRDGRRIPLSKREREGFINRLSPF